MSCDQPYLGWPSLVRRLDQMTFWDLCQPKLLHDSSHHIHRNNQIGLLFLVAFFLVIVHISLWNSYSIHYNPNIFLFFYSKLDYSLKIFRFAVSSILFCQSLQDLSYLQHLKKNVFSGFNLQNYLHAVMFIFFPFFFFFSYPESSLLFATTQMIMVFSYIFTTYTVLSLLISSYFFWRFKKLHFASRKFQNSVNGMEMYKYMWSW